jgi:hypothetical protein
MTVSDLGPVVYEPPLTRSGPWRAPGHGSTALRTGPRFIRGASRWHRVRSGTLHRHGEAWLMWCGQTRFGRDRPATSDPVPDDGLPLCGTCEGRAAGAGHTSPLSGDVDLLFRPARLDPPRWCPGGAPYGPARFLAEPAGHRVVRCGACGELIREKNYRWDEYGTGHHIAQPHEPGPGLVPGCPQHAWRHLTRTVEGVACQCAGIETQQEREGT